MNTTTISNTKAAYITANAAYAISSNQMTPPVKFFGTVHSNATLSNLWTTKELEAQRLLKEPTALVSKRSNPQTDARLLAFWMFLHSLSFNTLGKESKLFTMVPRALSSLVSRSGPAQVAIWPPYFLVL